MLCGWNWTPNISVECVFKASPASSFLMCPLQMNVKGDGEQHRVASECEPELQVCGNGGRAEATAVNMKSASHSREDDGGEDDGEGEDALNAKSTFPTRDEKETCKNFDHREN